MGMAEENEQLKAWLVTAAAAPPLYYTFKLSTQNHNRRLVEKPFKLNVIRYRAILVEKHYAFFVIN